MVTATSGQLRKLQNRKAAVVKCMRELVDDNNELTEEQEAEYEGFETDLAALEKSIAREEKLAEAERNMAAVPDRNQDTKKESSDRIGKIEDNQLKDPMKGFKSPRDFFSAVAEARNGRMDSRLKPLQSAAGSDEHSTQDDAYGGFLVPEAMLPEFLRTEPEPDPMLGRLANIPMNAPVVNLNARVDKNHSSSVSGGLTVTRTMETQASTSSRMAFEKVRLEAYSLFGLSYVTEELLVDSPVTIAALLQQGFRDEFTSNMINERLNGTGAGEHLGIMNSDCLVSVAKEGGQSADTIQIENLIKMSARCWGYDKAVWLANHDCKPELFSLNLASGSAGAIFYQPSLSADMPDMLLGRPIVYTEYCKTVGDKGDIVLGNWSQYLEGLYQPLKSDESVHVRFLNNERAFRLSLRNAGAPWWRSALTPKNSSDTLSPFVVLDARA